MGKEEEVKPTVVAVEVLGDHDHNHKKMDELAEKVASSVKSATFAQLFSTADSIDWMLMIAGTLGAAVTGGCFPFINVLFGRMIDSLNTDPSNFSNSVANLAADFCYVSLVNICSCSIQVACWSVAGERQTQKLREKYVRSILRQEIGFFDLNAASTLSTKVADLSGAVQDGITRRASEVFQYSAQFLGSYAVGLYLCWKLALVLVTALPLIGGAGAFMVLAVTSAQNTVGENYAAAGGIATESLSAIRTVSALNIQADIISKYRLYLSQAMQMGIKKGFNVGIGNGCVFGAFFFTYALGFWYGGQLVADDMERNCNPILDSSCITGGKVLATFFSIVMGSFSLGQMAPPLSAFIAAKAAVYPMMEVIDREPLIDGLSPTGLQPERKCEGHVELRDVVFAYPSRPNINACNGYSLNIKAGETVALVGASGAGKSTIINLLLRFYDVQGGGVYIDGNNIKDLNLRWLRSVFGYVGQEPVLFSGTIFDNIAYGLDSALVAPGKVERDEKLTEQVIAAAKAANAHEFISALPQGYKTDVGSNGVAMSGGQKQRIAIARALIKKPAVLLLDEATSALDATSERMVQESIDALTRGSQHPTVIIVAHRLSTIRSADKIAVVSEGRIVELGSHNDLMASKGPYFDLIQLQVDATADTAPEEEEVAAVVVEEATRPRAKSAAEQAIEKRKNSVDSKAETADVSVADEDYVVEDAKGVNGKVWGMVMKHKAWLAVAMVGGAGFGAVFPVLGLLLSLALGALYQPTGDEVRAKVAWVAIYYIIVAFGAISTAIMLYYGSAQLSERISMRLRSALFEALMRREIAFFDKEENAIGTLTGRLSNDSRAVAKASGELFAKFLQAVFTLVVGLIIGLIASWKLALVVLATFPLNALAGIVQQQAQMGLGRKKDTADDDGSEGAIISSAFNHMRTVSAFSMHFKVMEEYSEKTWRDSRRRQVVQFQGGIAFGVANGALFSTYAFLFWYGSTLIKSGEITFENMMRALFCIMFGAMGMGSALADLGDQKLGLQAADRIFKAVEAAESSPIDGLSAAGQRITTRARGGIELRDVHFHYPTRPDVAVCKGYNLTIQPGEVVAFVGPSGSGKSTIMNLLLRFYDPLAGEILLDGQNIKELNIQSLRSQIGYVGQEPVLFNMSIGDNIAKGRADVDRTLLSVDEALAESDRELLAQGCCSKGAANAGAKKSAAAYEQVVTTGDVEMGGPGTTAAGVPADIVQAATDANAHSFITAFSEQYDTDVGESSMMVSGGQKQRIAIARALIKKPAVLLLDEATSALDATSEKLVQENIDALTKDKLQTTLIVAHRLSTIRNADKIFVIDEGVVCQSGTHDELLKDKSGLYFSLWSKQNGSRSGPSANDLASMQ